MFVIPVLVDLAFKLLSAGWHLIKIWGFASIVCGGGKGGVSPHGFPSSVFPHSKDMQIRLFGDHECRECDLSGVYRPLTCRYSLQRRDVCLMGEIVSLCVCLDSPDSLLLCRSAKSTANVSVSPSVVELCRLRAPTVRPRQLRLDPRPATHPPHRYVYISVQHLENHVLKGLYVNHFQLMSVEFVLCFLDYFELSSYSFKAGYILWFLNPMKRPKPIMS